MKQMVIVMRSVANIVIVGLFVSRGIWICGIL